jgi:hypothetical protein
MYNKMNKTAVPLAGSAGVSSYRKPQPLALSVVSQCGVRRDLQLNSRFYIKQYAGNMLQLRGSISRFHWLCDKGHRSMAA